MEYLGDNASAIADLSLNFGHVGLVSTVAGLLFPLGLSLSWSLYNVIALACARPIYPLQNCFWDSITSLSFLLCIIISFVGLPGIIEADPNTFPEFTGETQFNEDECWVQENAPVCAGYSDLVTEWASLVNYERPLVRVSGTKTLYRC